jgi:hypothetical protein
MALELSGQDVLDRCALQRKLGIHPIEFGILSLQSLDPLDLRQRHAGVFALPLVIRRGTDAVLAAHLGYWHSRDSLSQNRQNLAVRKS